MSETPLQSEKITIGDRLRAVYGTFLQNRDVQIDVAMGIGVGLLNPILGIIVGNFARPLFNKVREDGIKNQSMDDDFSHQLPSTTSTVEHLVKAVRTGKIQIPSNQKVNFDGRDVQERNNSKK